MRAGESNISVYEVLPQVRGEHLVAYLVQYSQIRSDNSAEQNGGWTFEIILDCKAFIYVPNCLNIEDQKMSITVTGRKSTFWKCGEAGHLSYFCPKKASGILAPANPNPLVVVLFLSCL